MGTSHFESNVEAKDGTQTIKKFAVIQAASLVATDLDAKHRINVTNYIQVGTAKYIFSGTSTTSADVVADATALVSTPIKGSLYMGAGTVWAFNSDTTATKL